jgi:tryptophanyl-tRNA synthetase
MSLKDPNMKMSKSHADTRSRIRINDSTYDIATKVRLAVTDSLAGVTYQPEERPGVSNLLAIMSYLDDPGRSCEELADLHHEKSMRKFKDEVIRTTDRALAGIRERYNHLLGDAQGGYLDEVAREGAVKAKRIAENTMSTVRRVVGLT